MIDEFKSNEESFVSIRFSLLLLNISQEKAEKQQLLFKDANGKITRQQVAENQG